jgi:hypothetical protein
MQITLNIQNQQDLLALMPILEQLNISIAPQKTAKKARTQKRNIKNLAYHQNIIAQGGDVAAFGDAAEWQKQQRIDREMPR